MLGENTNARQCTQQPVQKFRLRVSGACQFVNRLRATREQISDAEFVALQWRVWNEDLLNLRTTMPINLVMYEKLFHRTELELARITAHLGISLEEQILGFAEESSRGNGRPMIGRDASSSYYSVYKSKAFDPNRRVAEMEAATRKAISGILSGSPVMGLYSEQPLASLGIRNTDTDPAPAISTNGVPTGIRTPVAAVKGRSPGPLDDGDAGVDLSRYWWS